MTNFRHVAAAACLLFIVAWPWSRQPVQASPLDGSDCGGVTVPETNSTFEQQVVELVNQERAKAGLPPLKRVSSLDDAARYFANDMVVDNYWPEPGKGFVSHGTYDRSNGSLVYVCSWDQRIGSFYSSPTGEDLAAGYSKPADVVRGWMASPGHRANLLSAGSWETGVGYAEGGTWGMYWVEDFGKRPGVYPLVINGEAAVTSSRDVALYVYGTWTDIRLKNDGSDWSDWQPFSNTLSWRLGQGVGDHIVYAEMRLAGGAEAISSDSIFSSDPTADPVFVFPSFLMDFLIR